MSDENNNQPQHPVVPDHRLKEITDALKSVQAQNEQLRGQIQYMQNERQAVEPEKPESPFDEQVDKAIEAKFQALLDPIRKQYDQQLGIVWDKADELAYKQKFGSEKYAKLQDKVDHIRKEQQANGRWVTREEALKLAHFELEGSKVQDPKPPENAPPVFDPYLGVYVDPLTRKPTAPQSLEGAPPVAPQAPQAPQVGQEQAQQAQRAGIPVPQEQIALPPQGVNQATPSDAPKGHTPISFNSSEAELDAWAEKYGDVPL